MCDLSKVTLLGRHKTAKKWLLAIADCGSWACPDCADKMVRLHQLRIIEACGVTLAGDWSFMTITAASNKRGLAASLANLKQGWTKLTERLRRLNGSRHYVLIHECHADGSLHIHMLYNAVIKTRWLKDNAHACGMGYQAKAELLRDGKSAGKYVTKYLAKSIAQGDVFPKRFKRVRYSVGFPRFTFVEQTSEYDWRAIVNFTATDMRMIRLDAQRAGVGITDQRVRVSRKKA